MRLTGSRAYTRAAPVPKMPPGLVELMEGLTKDVLRNNPSNVYEFCANHLEKLLEIRDGPSFKKPLSLGEKISKAQDKVRQRAKERQELFDCKVGSGADHARENVDSDKEPNSTQRDLVDNLRTPIHQEQEVSLSSEVEISHELTDNSLTSKDSIFDDTEENPSSKSSTFSSVSKSTVIDVITGTDNNIKEDVNIGIDNINMSKPEISKNEQVKKNEVVDDKKGNDDIFDKNIELPKIKINNDEPVQEGNESEIEKDQKNEIDIKKKHPSLDNIDEVQDNIESSVAGNINPRVDAEESDFTVAITCEKNSTEEHSNLMVEPQSIIVKNDIDHEPKINFNLDEANAIVEDGESMINKNDFISKIETDLSLEVDKNYVKDATIKNENDNVIDDIPNDIVLTKNIHNETEKDTGIANTDNAGDFLKENAQPEPGNDNAYHVIDVKTSMAGNAKDSDPEDISVQVEKTNENVNVSDEVFDKVKIPAKGQETGTIKTSADEKSEVFENNSADDSTESLLNINDNYSNDLEKKQSIIFTGDEEKVVEIHREDSVNSNSTSFQEPDAADNNDDNSVIGSDLTKVDDDIIRRDNENEQNNMDLETAAVTIQKVFRSFLFKSRNSTFEDITNDEATSLEEDNDKNKEEYYATANLNKERRPPLGITRMDTVLQTVNEEKSLSLSTDDSSTLSSAATTIQAHVRGFLVRNRLNSYKTVSTNSLVNSNEMLDTDAELLKNKTVLNIHIVPEEGNYLSRDESLITSMDLSLDGSPPSSINLHPLSYDLVSERRKLLKREDAIQSVSPPSNNSGKLSEDSVKEVLINEDISKTESNINEKDEQTNLEGNSPETLVTAVPDVTVDTSNKQEDMEINAERRKRSTSSDESDVITPFIASPRSLVGDFENSSKLMHSGEFHDVVLPTKVSRSDTSVVREFKNVLAYILLWNNL